MSSILYGIYESFQYGCQEKNIKSCEKYYSTDVIPVRLVIATALMAIARKVIIFDFEKITPPFIYGTAAVVLALGITYWLITKKT